MNIELFTWNVLAAACGFGLGRVLELGVSVFFEKRRWRRSVVRREAVYARWRDLCEVSK